MNLIINLPFARYPLPSPNNRLALVIDQRRLYAGDQPPHGLEAGGSHAASRKHPLGYLPRRKRPLSLPKHV